MARVWGYARGSVLPEFASIDVQQQEIEAYVKENLPDHEWMGLTVDDQFAARTFNFLERPCAAALNAQMQRWDHVVVARMDRGWRKMADFLHCCDLWTERGIVVHVLDFRFRSDDTLTFVRLAQLRAVSVWERRVAAERARGPAAFGTRVLNETYTRRKLGYKRRTVGWTKRGHPIRKLVPDKREQQAMREIVEMADTKHMIWSEIAQSLNNRGLVKLQQSGRVIKWTPYGTAWAYKVAKRMMESGEL